MELKWTTIVERFRFKAAKSLVLKLRVSGLGCRGLGVSGFRV